MTDKELILDFIKRLESLIANFKKNFEMPEISENPPSVKIEPNKYTPVQQKRTIKDIVLSNNLDINSDLWPLAVPEESIVTTKIQKHTRATMMASKLPKLYGKVLDFGCGEGHLVTHLKNQNIDAFGYDIKNHSEWSERNEELKSTNSLFTNDWLVVKGVGKYDAIILYDVIDHIIDETINEVTDKIKSILKDDGMICVFAHPWTSSHGGHLYETINKAYAHLFLNEDILDELCPERTYCLKITRPMAHYKTILEDKFTVKSKKAINNVPNSWVIENLVPIIVDTIFDNKLTQDQVIKILSLSGVYYQLGL